MPLNRCKSLCSSFYLQEQRASTKDNVERRLARTAEELAEEESDDDIDVVEENVDSDDSDSVPYNPKNLPLGWDGKVPVVLPNTY